MRRNSTPAITSQMYRHFAVTTVALTGLVAFFANGESHEATAASAIASHRLSPPHPAVSEQLTDSDADADPGSWGSDDEGDLGQSLSDSVAGSGARRPNPFALHPGSRAGTGEDPSLLDGQGGDEAAADLAPAAGAPTAGQIAAAAAASRLRSGAGGND
jgi:hypothetical protein